MLREGFFFNAESVIVKMHSRKSWDVRLVLFFSKDSTVVAGGPFGSLETQIQESVSTLNMAFLPGKGDGENIARNLFLFFFNFHLLVKFPLPVCVFQLLFCTNRTSITSSLLCNWKICSSSYGTSANHVPKARKSLPQCIS